MKQNGTIKTSLCPHPLQCSQANRRASVRKPNLHDQGRRLSRPMAEQCGGVGDQCDGSQGAMAPKSGHRSLAALGSKAGRMIGRRGIP